MAKHHKFQLPVWARVSLLAGGLLFVAANTAAAGFFLDRIYPGVKVAGVAVGGLTRDEAHHRLEAAAAEYKLDISLASQSYHLRPNQLGVDYDIDTTVSEAYAVGRDEQLIPLALLDAHQTPASHFAYTVDQASLGKFVTQVATTNSVAPLDAAITVVSGQPQVAPEKSGFGVDPKQLNREINMALETQSSLLSITPQPIDAEIKAADTADAVAAARKIMALHVESSYQDRAFMPTAEQIGDWLVFTKTDGHLVPAFDPVKVKAYVQTVANSIYKSPKNHLVNVVNGAVTGEEQGEDGLSVDQDGLVNGLIASLTAGGAPATLAIQTVPVKFKTVYNRTFNLDAPKYIEINLSTQHLWAYQDHQPVFESAVTSGATGAGFPTVTGLFSVLAKERNRYLNGHNIGYNYNVYVQYWMPFYADYGLHDASWRSSFGGSDYYYAGSHGCVNLPLETAAWLFNWADVGTPVWVHT